MGEQDEYQAHWCPALRLGKSIVSNPEIVHVINRHDIERPLPAFAGFQLRDAGQVTNTYKMLYDFIFLPIT